VDDSYLMIFTADPRFCDRVCPVVGCQRPSFPVLSQRASEQVSWDSLAATAL
jgi:hypothetical protein